jgi:hypothetical protein
MLSTLTVTGGFLYLSGGVGLNQPICNFFRMKDDLTGAWQPLPALPAPRQSHSTRANPPLIYFDTPGLQTDVFNTLTDEWEEPEVASLQPPRAVHLKEFSYYFGGKQLILKRDRLTEEVSQLSPALQDAEDKLRRLGDPSLASYAFAL